MLRETPLFGNLLLFDTSLPWEESGVMGVATRTYEVMVEGGCTLTHMHCTFIGR
jgi:hypothetical protein